MWIPAKYSEGCWVGDGNHVPAAADKRYVSADFKAEEAAKSLRKRPPSSLITQSPPI